jgi:hypothetical protein
VTEAPEPSQPDSGVGAGGQPIPGARRPEVGGIPRQPDAVWPETDQAPADSEAATEGAAAPPAKRTRGQVIRLVLAVVVGVVAVLCIGGAVTGFFVYRKISEPDRSTPGVSLRQYLDAELNQRDDSRAGLFTCRDASGLGPVQALRADLESKERQFHVTITASPEGFDPKISDSTASVAVKVRLSVSQNGSFQEEIQTWRFAMRNQSGWRVCAGQQLS